MVLLPVLAGGTHCRRSSGLLLCRPMEFSVRQKLQASVERKAEKCCQHYCSKDVGKIFVRSMYRLLGVWISFILYWYRISFITVWLFHCRSTFAKYCIICTLICTLSYWISTSTLLNTQLAQAFKSLLNTNKIQALFLPKCKTIFTLYFQELEASQREQPRKVVISRSLDNAIQEVLDLISKHSILTWYQPLTKDKSFIKYAQ